jgi:chromate reductase, NAD(P)H dehydrogenase (quinone)
VIQSEKVKILAISGSLRRGSFCTSLIRSLAKSVTDTIEITFHDIGDIPLFNEDMEREGTPAGVLRLRRAVAESDGVLIVTPEYNHGIPGVLKNALDWVSQPFQRSVFRRKPVSSISTSVAFTGGVRAQYQLRETLHSMLAMVVPGPEVVIGGVHGKIDGQCLLDEKTLGYVKCALDLLRDEILANSFRAELDSAMKSPTRGGKLSSNHNLLA